jgi:carboxypeptidase T
VHPAYRLVIAAAALVALPAVPARAADGFPAGYEGFHTYEEMAAEVAAVAAAHPDIVHAFTIGTSAKGRPLWAAKVSDNVAVDEDEPEVLFDGLHHGNEHMSLEMTLAILGWLADGYGTDPRITTLVDTRETWIVFAVNPDGGAFDVLADGFRDWRKNRQRNPDGTVGTDLNRNYDYRWGSAGTSGSPVPGSSGYRGRRPFSAPESRAMRDFLASRVVGGRQQVRAGISFHEYGRQVMWPYGYTLADVPPDMTADDAAALRRIGRHMAASSGYTPLQASDIRLASGTSRDHAYGRYRIFAYTVELSAVNYPKDTKIVGETGRNREAVLWFMEQAWCPLNVLGASVTAARCGTFDDDLEVSRGWQLDPDGTDTAGASGGRWQRADPAATRLGGTVMQRSGVPSGRAAFVTGAAAGSRPAANDLDGRTTIRSTPMTLPAGVGQRLTFRWLLAHSAASGPEDRLRAIIETEDGTQVTAWERAGTPVKRGGSWGSASVALDAWAGQTIRIRFEAVDAGAGGVVEAGIDDVRVTRPAGS